ncbi:unnamed protein product [Peronospora farinosa]|uniref:Clathrin/coatomer adaptor adaptin-like N-terminal domain-containing protein n=1 Tax=Peronospora farinosa TaxID=134698 RepID=A0AAV0UGJ2_9STRA|nr:unnamed protein product [Peronospora farinosa]CAI5735463.1 unnamed protein product [Peronospora farinosa]
MVDKKVLMILSNPDLTILAVNTFVKDAADSNPLVRTLSVRTMGCIRVDRIIEYRCEPLRRFLKDEDPLNPTVVANAIAALFEISEDSAGVTAFTITKIYARGLHEAEGIIERVTPRLQHANSASMIWIIGEYAERIDNADELLESFMDFFDDETAQVQLQLLTATVKMFLKRLNETQEIIQKVLHKATEESDNLDLRDREYSDRSDDTCALEPSVLDQLIGKISTLASVYHKFPSAFVVRLTVPEVHGRRQDNHYSVDGEGESEGSFDQTEDGRIGQKAGDPVDLLDMGTFTLGDPSSIASDPVAATLASASLVDIFGGPAAPPAPVGVSGNAVQKNL